MSEYFSHDYDTRNDEKIIALLSEMGWEGYGLYWGLVELLYQNDGYMLMQCGRIAYALRTKQEKVKQVIEGFELFVIDGDKFYSNSVLNRLEQRNEKSEKARQSALKRWENANAKRPHSDSNAIKKRKEKESKESKEEIERTFELFWDHYHLTTGKPKKEKEPALKYWKKLTYEERVKAYQMVKDYKNSVDDPKFIKYARTYLSDKNFNDELRPAQKAEPQRPTYKRFEIRN